MTKYNQGYNWEQAIRKKAENKGAYVMRSGGSKGIADLAILREGKFYLIQAKKQKNLEFTMFSGPSVEDYLTKEELKKIDRIYEANPERVVFAVMVKGKGKHFGIASYKGRDISGLIELMK